MAYREFRNEATYEAPNLEFLPRTLATLDTVQRLKAIKEQRRASAYDNAKVAGLKGYFPQIQDGLNNLVATAKEGLNQWYVSGRSGRPIEVENIMTIGQNVSNKAETLYNATKKIEQEIKDREVNDPYYKSGADRERFTTSVFDPELGIDKIDELERRIVGFKPGQNKLETFNAPKYLDDFVKSYGDKQTSSDNKDKAGIKIASDYKGKFFNPDGTPGINTQHVEKVLSNEDANEYYTQSMLKDLNQELRQIKAGRLEEIPTSKEGEILRELINQGDDQAAINYLREHPEINPIDQRTEFQRKADKIIPELKDREAVHMKRESDLSGRLPNSQWGIGNKEANDAADGQVGGLPMRVVTLSKGTGPSKLPFLPATKAAARKNIDTGEVTYSGSGNVPMTINYYAWGPVDKEGAPILTNGQSIEEAKRTIENLPLDVRANLKAAPIFFGNSTDKASVLNLAYSGKRIAQLEEEARKNPEGDIARDLTQLQESLKKMEADEAYDTQLIQKYFGTDVVRNEAFAVTKNDPNETQYESLTGIRVWDPKSLNPEMKDMKSFIEKTAEAAKKELLQKGQEFKGEMEKIQQRNEEKVTGGKQDVVESTADEVEKWTPDKQYKVGNAVYFFDQTTKEWKKR